MTERVKGMKRSEGTGLQMRNGHGPTADRKPRRDTAGAAFRQGCSTAETSRDGQANGNRRETRIGREGQRRRPRRTLAADGIPFAGGRVGTEPPYKDFRSRTAPSFLNTFTGFDSGSASPVPDGAGDASTAFNFKFAGGSGTLN